MPELSHEEGAKSLSKRALLKGMGAVFAGLLAKAVQAQSPTQSPKGLQTDVFKELENAIENLKGKDKEDFEILQGDNNALNALILAFAQQLLVMQDDERYGQNQRKMLNDLNAFMKGFKAKFIDRSKLPASDPMTERALRIMRTLCLAIAQES